MNKLPWVLVLILSILLGLCVYKDYSEPSSGQEVSQEDLDEINKGLEQVKQAQEESDSG